MSEYYAIYNWEFYISFWTIYKRRCFLWDKKICKFSVYNGVDDVNFIFNKNVLPQLESLNGKKADDRTM